ncbi:hypothetical protein SCA6_017013 [Theobroma cacao]
MASAQPLPATACHGFFKQRKKETETTSAPVYVKRIRRTVQVQSMSKEGMVIDLPKSKWDGTDFYAKMQEESKG